MNTLNPADRQTLRLLDDPAHCRRTEMVVRCGLCPGGRACCRNQPRPSGVLTSLFRRRRTR